MLLGAPFSAEAMICRKHCELLLSVAEPLPVWHDQAMEAEAVSDIVGSPALGLWQTLTRQQGAGYPCCLAAP